MFIKITFVIYEIFLALSDEHFNVSYIFIFNYQNVNKIILILFSLLPNVREINL